MDRKEIISELGKYFKVKELVCNHVYAKWGEDSWRFLDTDALEVLLCLRKYILCVPLVVNSGISFQRGLRCNRCELVASKTAPYLSAHVLGKGFDITPSRMTAEQARKAIRERADLLPCNVRIEDEVGWLHIDVMPVSDEKVHFFKP